MEQLEPAIPEELVLTAAPENGVAEKAGDPDQEGSEILKRQEPAAAERERVVENGPGHHPSGCRAKKGSGEDQRPPGRAEGPEQQGGGQWVGEDLPDVTPGPRTAGAT